MYKIFEIDTTLNTNEQNYLTGKCIVLHLKYIYIETNYYAIVNVYIV